MYLLTLILEIIAFTLQEVEWEENTIMLRQDSDTTNYSPRYG
jgi:hypothetical protein